jgi:hypothetical protein
VADLDALEATVQLAVRADGDRLARQRAAMTALLLAGVGIAGALPWADPSAGEQAARTVAAARAWVIGGGAVAAAVFAVGLVRSSGRRVTAAVCALALVAPSAASLSAVVDAATAAPGPLVGLAAGASALAAAVLWAAT